MRYDLIFSFEKTPQGLPAYVYFEGLKYELRYSDRVSWQEVLHDEMKSKTVFTFLSVHPHGDSLSNKIIKLETLKWIKRMAALSRPFDFEKPQHAIVFSLKGLNGWPIEAFIGNTWHKIIYYEIQPLLRDEKFLWEDVKNCFAVEPGVNQEIVLDIARHIRAYMRNMPEIHEGLIDSK